MLSRPPPRPFSSSLKLTLAMCLFGCIGGKSEVICDELEDDCVDNGGGGGDYTGSLEPLSAFTASGGNCVATSQGMVNLTGQGLLSHETVGYDGSRRPATSSVNTERSSGACPEATGNKSTNPGSGILDPKTGDTWNSGLGDLSGCYLSSTCGGSDPSSCNGDYKVTIIPESGVDCDDYDTVRIDLQPRASFAMRRYSGDSDCSAGSGRFQLVPVRRIDRDNDGSMSVYLLPVQVSGTGVMTAKADVTAISKVSGPSGVTLRVLKPDMEVGFSSSDTLVNASTKSLSITGQHSFSAGEVAGNPAFVLEEIAESNFDDTQVDLTWSCGSSGTSVTRPQGYSFDLDDIGCTDAIARMTLRVPSSPNRVEWEQYGNGNWSYVSPTTTVNGTKAFSITYGDFFVDGAVLSTSGSQAQVRFDNIEWLGVDVCTPGTYTFGVE